MISIDRIKTDSVYAYANEGEFSKFLSQGYAYQLLMHPGDLAHAKMSDFSKKALSWDSYPTYSAYVSIMNSFQANHPDICKIVDIGTTANGHKLLYAKITENVNTADQAGKLEFTYSSTIHGDETTGYILMLHLIDSLLSGYGNNARITNLLNSTQIWINPLANPDGTYYSGDSTVNGAIRYNGSFVDLNRNFPDAQAGQHPDGYDWQPETIAMMNFFASHHFVLSINFHSGDEVYNYPWDTWEKLHPDADWFNAIGRAYADTVHNHSPQGYFTGPYADGSANGVTDGYAWYQITGGRQDYMTYFMHGREATIELSYDKTPPASTLLQYWDYHKASLLNYIENTYYGIRGTVTSLSGKPLKAIITIQNHDADHSEAISDSATGFYIRMISPGTYTVTISADSCYPRTFHNVTVTSGAATALNAQLQPFNVPFCEPLSLSAGWNLVSPTVTATNLLPATLFPDATSPIYQYDSVYSVATAMKSGSGYWVKYPGSKSVNVCGYLAAEEVPLKAGWNLIGITGNSVPVSAIQTSPTGIITSPFYCFKNVYTVATTLVPGTGYWVKASQAGMLIFAK